MKLSQLPSKAKGWYHVLLAAAVALLAACTLSSAPDSTSTPATALACPQLISAAIQTANNACRRLGLNQICYGYPHVEVTFQTGSPPRLVASGDTADLLAASRASTMPLDEANQTWGIAIIKAQLNLPETSLEPSVTLVLYGGAALDGLSPTLTAARLQTSTGLPPCPEAPPAALLIQSPPGTSATLTLNGASLTLGSTVYVTAPANGTLTIATLEGTVVVSARGTTRIVRPGAQVRLPLGGDGGQEVIGAPSEPEPLDTDKLRHAPFALLERPVTLPAPLVLSTAAAPTPPVPTTAPAVVIPCIPRPDWAGTITVQRGDTLSTIARRVQLSLAELQQGNCLTNPDRIFPGQTLRVPGTPFQSTSPVPALLPTASGGD